jgi:hypothetical protein
VTFYFNTLRTTDDIRAVVHLYPLTVLDESGKALTTRGHFEIVFINSGNRPAAILNQTYYVEQKGRSCSDAEPASESEILFSDLQPFVLKENEVALKQANLLPTGKRESQEPETVISIPLLPENMKAERINLTLCVAYMLSTPSLGRIYAPAPDVHFQIDKKGTISFDALRGYFGTLSDIPIVLHHRRGAIFLP